MREQLRNLLARVLRPRAMTSQDLARELGQGWETDSGAYITPQSAMRLTDVYACVRVVAETIAQVPLILYRRTKDGKERAEDHWLYGLLHDRPNPWQTAFEFREMMQAHVELSGNAYALKTMVRGEIRELLPVPPHRVQILQEPASYRVHYSVTMPDGRQQPFEAEQVLHLRGLSLDGIAGLSPVGYQRELLGYTQQVQKYGARMYKHGALVGGVLQHPNLVSEKARKRLKEDFEEKYAGSSNAWKTILLEEGVTFTKTGMSARDAEFLGAMQFSKRQIATMFRIPPHMIGDLADATFTNIEHQGIDFVVHSMGPRFVRFEQRLGRALIPEREQKSLFVEFLVDGLLRGDTASRYAAYNSGIMAGWLSRNEVRAKENLDQGPPELDEFLEPRNITGNPQGDGNTEPPPKKKPVPDEEDEEAVEALLKAVGSRRNGHRAEET